MNVPSSKTTLLNKLSPLPVVPLNAPLKAPLAHLPAPQIDSPPSPLLCVSSSLFCAILKQLEITPEPHSESPQCPTHLCKPSQKLQELQFGVAVSLFHCLDPFIPQGISQTLAVTLPPSICLT